MPLFRLIILLLLVAGGASFLAYIVTGKARYRKLGLRAVGAALLAAMVFFAVLIAERLMTSS